MNEHRSDSPPEARLRKWYEGFEPADSSALLLAASRRLAEERAHGTRRVVGPRRLWMALAAGLLAAGMIALVAAPMLLAPHPSPVLSSVSPSSSASPTESPSEIPSEIPSPEVTPSPPSDDYDVVETLPGGNVWAIYRGHIEISTDRGLTWTVVPTPELPSTSPYRRFAAADELHAWVLHAPNVLYEKEALVVYRTADGGRSWQSTAIPGHFRDWPAQLVFTNAQRGYISLWEPKGDLHIYRTDDGGATWTPVAKIHASYLTVSDASTLWAGGEEACDGCAAEPLLQVSRNGGATWSGVSLPGVGSKLAAHDIAGSKPGFYDSSNGFFAVSRKDSSEFGSSIIYGTQDGGRSWKQVGTINWPLSRITAVSRSMLVAGIFANRFRPGIAVDFSGPTGSTDGGKTWHSLLIGWSPRPPSGFCYSARPGVYVCGDNTPAYATDTWISEDLGLTWHRPGSTESIASPWP